jgi:hypothetical protein
MIRPDLCKPLLTLACLLALGACAKDDDKDDDKDDAGAPGQGDASGETIPDAPADGTLGGAAWTFVAGTARPAIDGSGELSVTLYSADRADPCSLAPAPDGRYLGFTVPAEAARTDFPRAGNAYVSLGSGADTGTTHIDLAGGAVIVEAVSDTAVTGRLYVDDRSGSTVAGTFTAARCTKDPFAAPPQASLRGFGALPRPADDCAASALSFEYDGLHHWSVVWSFCGQADASRICDDRGMRLPTPDEARADTPTMFRQGAYWTGTCASATACTAAFTKDGAFDHAEELAPSEELIVACIE